MRTVTRDELVFDVTADGPPGGEPVVLLHGFPQTARCWELLTPLLTAQGLRTVALRFANVYGPRSELKKGAVTAFIQRALRGDALPIYGDGAATRDFIYVDDLCQGIVLGLEHPDARGVFHLASERETAIAELAGLVVGATGADVPIEHLPPRPGEVERNFASCELARRTLGFAPGVDLEEGLARTVAWFRAAG